MLQQINIDNNFNKETASSIIKKWIVEENKVFHLIGDLKKKKY